MTETTSLPLFLVSIIAISLTGVMMPGPVTAVAVTKGIQHKKAGALIALGHGIIEFPLIALLYFGFARYFEFDGVRIAVGIIGGIVLVTMAVGMLKTSPPDINAVRNERYNSVLAGLATTAANPYFFLWWATVGAALLAGAHEFGGVGVVAFGITHWLCDAAWLLLLTWLVFNSKKLWTERVHRVVFSICAVVLAGFGGWFVYSGISLAVAP